MIWDVWIQAGYYGIVMLCTILLLGAVQKGFLWKYLKVRASFGRLILIKARAINQDYFKVGEVSENMLVFHKLDDKIKIQLDSKANPIYRCLGIQWVDWDEETNNLSKTDYSTVASWDANKFSNLLKRALMRPAIGDNKEYILIVLCILAIVAGAIGIYLGFRNYQLITALARGLPEWLNAAKGSITTGGI